MRRAKGFEWILLAAVLVVPAIMFARWKAELKSSAAAATKPARVTAAPISAPADPRKSEPVPPESPPNPVEPPGEPVLLAMRDPMVSPIDRIRMNPPKAPAPEPEFIPPPPPPPRIDAGIRLEGVIMAEDQARRAIVNGTVLEVGGTVKGAEVLRIDADGVLFGKGGKRFTKRLGD